jgi:hypothetical protein
VVGIEPNGVNGLNATKHRRQRPVLEALRVFFTVALKIGVKLFVIKKALACLPCGGLGNAVKGVLNVRHCQSCGAAECALGVVGLNLSILGAKRQRRLGLRQALTACSIAYFSSVFVS